MILGKARVFSGTVGWAWTIKSMHHLFRKSSVRLSDSHGSIWFYIYISMYIHTYIHTYIRFYMILVHGISTRSWNRAPAKSLRLPADKGAASSQTVFLRQQVRVRCKRRLTPVTPLAPCTLICFRDFEVLTCSGCFRAALPCSAKVFLVGVAGCCSFRVKRHWRWRQMIEEPLLGGTGTSAKMHP